MRLVGAVSGIPRIALEDVEVDGWLFHAARRNRWERDLERDALLQERGWQIVHMSWRMVTSGPDACADRLRRILALR